MMTEGQEKEEFWNVLGGKGDYSNSPRLQVRSTTARTTTVLLLLLLLELLLLLLLFYSHYTA